MKAGLMAVAAVALLCGGLACCRTLATVERSRPRFTEGPDGGTLAFGPSDNGIAFGERGLRIGSVRIQRTGWEAAEITGSAQAEGTGQWKIRLDGSAPNSEVSVGPLACRCGKSKVASIGLG